MRANWLLVNGRFYTMDRAAPQVTALAIYGERIVAVGETEGLRDEFLASEVLNLGGRCVIPGLTDAHVHFESYALSLQWVDLHEVPSLEEALRRVAARVAQTPPGKWIRGHGWFQELWPGRAFPTAADLDRVAPHNPAFLTHKSGHACWVNSRALEIAGISADTPDPEGGQIVRDANGTPTGLLLEDTIGLVSEHVPEPAPDEVDAALRAAFPRAHKLGLTGIHDCDGRGAFLAYQRLHQQGELGLRVHKHVPSELLDDAICVGLRSGLGDDWLRVGHVKIFADGALGPRTAWMIAPFEGEPHNRGLPIHAPEALGALICRAAEHDFACAVHAIGDQANRAVLDALGRLDTPALHPQHGASVRDWVLPHRIEHVQLLHPDDVPRLAELGVVASMQPLHATQDMDMADRYWGARAALSYAWKSLLDQGTVLAFGSDSPVEDLSPFPGLYAAVTRRRPESSPPLGGTGGGQSGWYPEQRLTVAEAVSAYTLGAARAAGAEGRLGSLTPGKLADLVVLDRDIFEVEHEEILEARPLGTMIGGRWAHRELS
jgi:predicted amidohydrolase YtcJ